MLCVNYITILQCSVIAETTIPLSDQYLNDRLTLGGNTLSANSTRARTIDIPQDSALHYLTMALDSVQLPTKMDEARDCVNSMGLEYYDQVSIYSYCSKVNFKYAT